MIKLPVFTPVLTRMKPAGLTGSNWVIVQRLVGRHNENKVKRTSWSFELHCCRAVSGGIASVLAVCLIKTLMLCIDSTQIDNAYLALHLLLSVFCTHVQTSSINGKITSRISGSAGLSFLNQSLWQFPFWSNIDSRRITSFCCTWVQLNTANVMAWYTSL